MWPLSHWMICSANQMQVLTWTVDAYDYHDLALSSTKQQFMCFSSIFVEHPPSAARKDVGNTHFKVFSITPYKEIQDSLGFWIPRCGFRIPEVLDSSFCQWNLNSGFQSLVGFRTPWAVFRIPKTRISDSTNKNSRTLKSWFPYTRWLVFSFIIACPE